MGPEIMISFKYVLFIQAVLMIHAVSPDFSPDLWNTIIRRWQSQKGKLILKRRQRVAEKRKKYWEIDMKDLR
jgi:hypothetical protein